MDPFIKASNVVFNYDDGYNALNLQDLSINQGEFVAIIGSNGSGKSTFLKCLNAILVPNSGNVIIDGMDTLDKNKTLEIRKTVGLVLQNPDNQIVSSLVCDDVAFGPENLGFMPEKIKNRVDYALKSVGMYSYKDKQVHKLSGGQKQRVAIAGIMAMNPKCIALDEPTSMLDPKGRKDIINILLKLNKEHGITIILVTHFMDEAAISDRVILMDKGEIKLSGKPEAIFSKVDLLKRYNLSVPVSTKLLYELKNHGFNVNNNIVNIDDCVDEVTKLLEAKLCH